MATARESLLARARELVIAGRWADVSMAQVAAAAGVSRQTLYNEFGNREGLMAAVARQAAERFRTGTLLAAQQEQDPVSAVAAAMRWALATAHEDPLVKAGLTDDAAGLLPYLTTRAADVLPPISADLAAWLDTPGAPWACEVAVRLTVSHLLLPTSTDEQLVDAVTALIRPLLVPAGPA